jgi:hypothetical protein
MQKTWKKLRKWIPKGKQNLRNVIKKTRFEN